MTCASCEHSISYGRRVLWCVLHRIDATSVCGDFCRCPGADESERGQ